MMGVFSTMFMIVVRIVGVVVPSPFHHCLSCVLC